MSEQKKPQAGEWWFANDGSGRVYVIGSTTTGLRVCQWTDGEVSRYLDWDNWHHEPRCNSWEWQPEPEPEWFDLTAMDEHKLRANTDRGSTASVTGAEEWRDGVQWPEYMTVAIAKHCGWKQFRCLLKDAPTPATPPADAYGRCPICSARGKSRERRINGNDACENGHLYPSKDAIYGDATPEPKPATQTIVFHEFMVRCGVGNEDWQLKWRTSKPKTNNWIPTGRTETREVVR